MNRQVVQIFIAVLLFSLNSSAQSLSSSTQASAGGSAQSDQFQLNWTIGQPFNGTTSDNGISILTQGFQQPELQVWTSYVGTMIFPGKELKVPYKASGIISYNNTYTAELSDREGNFDRPVNIGTFRGNMNGEILAKIPSNTIAGNKYLVRVTSSTSPFTGTDNGAPLSLKRLLMAKVLPNPFVHTFSIEADGATDEPIIIRVLSLGGRLLDQQRLGFAKGYYKFGESYRPGAYFVEIIQGQQRVIQKVEKLPY